MSKIIRKLKMKNFMSLVKFSHTLFAMPFAIAGYFLAVTTTQASFSWKTFVLVILCMVFARNAAMAFNRYIDRKIDKINPRTAKREIPAGILSPRAALAFVILNSVLFIICTYFINTLTFFLSPVALFVILFYSYTKRFTSLCHFVLGLGLALAPLGAYLSVTGKFAILPLILSAIVFFWVSGFDVIYALQDEGFDKKLNLKSIPSALGGKLALRLSSIVHIGTAILVLILGLLGGLGLYFFIGALVFISFLIYQHSLVKPNKLDRVNLAFFTANGLASVLFSCLFIVDLYFPISMLPDLLNLSLK